ncbi:hypothetical protein tpqmel_0895 [Candidatus Gastranaerophilus sp. (ex Termes propinquus)]|nr:hypothetical protein tpqmel_0895 [Candidatus Gastranaerophilus sp. (ex Termes propinquus)]
MSILQVSAQQSNPWWVEEQKNNKLTNDSFNDAGSIFGSGTSSFTSDDPFNIERVGDIKKLKGKLHDNGQIRERTQRELGAVHFELLNSKGEVEKTVTKTDTNNVLESSYDEKGRLTITYTDGATEFHDKKQ